MVEIHRDVFARRLMMHVRIWSAHQLATVLALKVILEGIVDLYTWSCVIFFNKSVNIFS